MKKIVFTLIFLAPCFSLAAPVKPWGLGVILHNPTGFSVKHRISKESSIDAALGYSFRRSDNLTIHASHLWEFNEGIRITDQVRLGYYFGVGGAFHSRDRNESPPPWAEDDPNDELGLAIRGVGGLNYYFDHPTFEVFAELALNFFFVPATDADFGLAVGGRYFF